MKTIMFLLSFMFVSCVTANTETRELSGVNPETENLAIDDNTSGVMLAHHKDECGNYIPHDEPARPTPKKSFWERLFGSLDDPYKDIIINKEGVKVASYGDLNAFDLLKESQTDTEEAPIKLATDYDTCVKCCIDEGGSSSQCRRVCEE